MPAKQVINLGIIGLSSEKGWAAKAVVPTLKALQGIYRLIALCTTSQESATAASKKYSQFLNDTEDSIHPCWSGSAERISNIPGIDLFAVIIRSSGHFSTAMPIIEQGKNIFIEWPAGRNLEETVKMAEAAKSSGSRVYVGLQGRHSTVIRKVREIVHSGQIGTIVSTSVIGCVPKELKYWGPWISANNMHTSDPETGSSLSDIALGHFLDSFMSIFGDFSHVIAQSSTHFKEAIVIDSKGNPTDETVPQLGADQVSFSGMTKSGLTINLHFRGGISCLDGQSIFIWLIDGEKGCIRLENDAPPAAFLNIADPKLFVNGKEVAVEANPLGNVGKEWSQMALEDGGDCATIEEAVKVRKVLKGIEESAKQGKRYDFA